MNIYYPSGEEESLGSTIQFDRARQLIGGDVQIITLGAGQRLIVNGDGGPLGLPVNPRASAILQAAAGKRGKTVAVVGPAIHFAKGDRWADD